MNTLTIEKSFEEKPPVAQSKINNKAKQVLLKNSKNFQSTHKLHQHIAKNQIERSEATLHELKEKRFLLKKKIQNEGLI